MKHIPTYEEFVNESILNEARVKAATLLEEIIAGNTSRAEGIKMSVDLAEHYLNWLKTSPYGKKNADIPLHMLIKASFNWGIERGLDPKLKVQLDTLKTTINKPVNEGIDVGYWTDYHDVKSRNPMIDRPSDKQVQSEVETCVEYWNEYNENGKENEVTPAGEKKVLKLAKEFAKAAGWISIDVIEAMIAQES
jgi:hypothetical protein